MPSKIYGSFIGKALNKEIDWDSDTIKVALCTSSYPVNQDTDDYWSDAQPYEASGTGYTAGGLTLTSKSLTFDAATNKVTLDAADVTWANSTITARYAVIYDAQTGVNTTSPLIGYVDFGTDQSSSSGSFVISWAATGILQVTIA